MANPEDCPIFDTCYKVGIILDKDLTDFQYAEAIRAVCAACSGVKEHDSAGERKDLGNNGSKTLTVKLSGELYTTFIETVTEKGGRWRGKETFNGAVESAVTAALMLFLQNLDGDAELPGFRDYINEKYPELDKDMVTMMEGLILREKQRKGDGVYPKR